MDGPFPDMDEAKRAKNSKGNHHSTDDTAALDIWDAGDDDYNIAPREWLLGNTFCKKFLSSLTRQRQAVHCERFRRQCTA